MEKYNVFLEGIPGSGKSTLLNHLSEQLTEYQAYREGDISPVELAWCSYLTKEQYEEALEKFPELAYAIESHMVKEDEYYIVAYTQIRTEHFEFYQYMEQFEIYSGRRDDKEFREIIYKRFSNFSKTGNLFECSFFQNIIDELLLYKCYSDEEVVEFYQGLIKQIDMKNFKLIRLVTSDMEQSILKIKAERVNDQGEEDWYRAMTEYLANAPYSKNHKLEGLSGLMEYFNKRLEMEQKVIEILPKGCYLELPSKEYEIKDALEFLK